MQPIATVILATLLPTGLLILGLLSLSLSLFFQLRLSRKKNSAIKEPHTTEEHPVAEQPVEEPQKKPEWLEYSRSQLGSDLSPLSDEENPDWEYDMGTVVFGLNNFIGLASNPYTEPGVEVWAEKILDALGYRGGVPTKLILELLQGGRSRDYIQLHLTAWIGFSIASIESEPESTLLPFSPNVQKSLASFFNAIKGITVPPELSSVIAKIPSQMAEAHGEINKERVEKVVDLLDKLFEPTVDKADSFDYVQPEDRARVNKGRAKYEIEYTRPRDFAKVITMQMRLLGSPQKFEIRWIPTDESVICCIPVLYAHAGEDGVLLQEPKLWTEGSIYDKKSGSWSDRGGTDLKRSIRAYELGQICILSVSEKDRIDKGRVQRQGNPSP